MTVERITSDIYRIEIPLPNNPLKSVNSYLIKASDRNLLVDPGMNQDECFKAMHTSLNELGADLKKTDFFITHSHPDHLGLVSRLATNESAIYLAQPDVDRLQRVLYGTLWAEMVQFALVNGFPETDLQEIARIHPTRRFRFKDCLVFKVLKEGDKIGIGDHLFKCIESPGHTKGHMCLHEANRKILVVGDHILDDITPNISLRSDGENPLKEYLESLKKVYELNDIEIVLPGHRTPFRNYRRRILELERHHHERAGELLSLLQKESQNAYRLASQMRWNVSYQSWEKFPLFQKWVAVGEVMAHLKYLEEEGRIRRVSYGERIVYTLN